MPGWHGMENGQKLEMGQHGNQMEKSPELDWDKNGPKMTRKSRNNGKLPQNSFFFSLSSWSECVKWRMGWVVVGTAVFGAPRFLAKTLEKKHVSTKSAPKTAVPTTTHPIRHLTPSYFSIWFSIFSPFPVFGRFPCHTSPAWSQDDSVSSIESPGMLQLSSCSCLKWLKHSQFRFKCLHRGVTLSIFEGNV